MASSQSSVESAVSVDKLRPASPVVEGVGEVDNPPESIDKEEEEAAEKVHQHYNEFLTVVKRLPDRFCTKAPKSELPSYLEVIGKIVYGQNKELLNTIRNDSSLALKLWQFVLDGSNIILKDVLAQKDNLLNRPHIETSKMLEENGEAIRVAFAAITNFIGADISAIPTEKYCSIVQQLDSIWYQGALDEFKGVPYSPLENLTVDKERSKYLMESSSLSLANLVDRARKYSFDSPQFASLVRAIANLCQVPKVMGELLESRLENETEVYLEYIIPAMELQNPPHLRVTISGLFKNLAMFPDGHSILLDKDREFLSCALSPIVGTGEYSDEEMMNLPVSLYGTLLNEVPRDPHPTVRCNTVEFIYQLCSIRSSREALREQNVYCLMREYHKWEQDESLLDLIEQVVNILIQTEEEIGVEDFKTLTSES